MVYIPACANPIMATGLEGEGTMMIFIAAGILVVIMAAVVIYFLIKKKQKVYTYRYRN